MLADKIAFDTPAVGCHQVGDYWRDCRSALLHLHCIVVVDDDMLASGSTFKDDVRCLAHDNLFTYAYLVEQMRLFQCQYIPMSLHASSSISVSQTY